MKKRKNSKIDIVDCDEQGLILKEGPILSWDEVEVIGKCEYRGRELTSAIYYIQKKNNPQNLWVPNLGRFSFFRNEGREEKEVELKLKIIKYAKKNPGPRFVIKDTHFGKEKPWDIEKEEEMDRYWTSPFAQRASEDYKREAPLIITSFFVVTVLLLLILWIFSLLRP